MTIKGWLKKYFFRNLWRPPWRSLWKSGKKLPDLILALPGGPAEVHLELGKSQSLWLLETLDLGTLFGLQQDHWMALSWWSLKFQSLAASTGLVFWFEKTDKIMFFYACSILFFTVFLLFKIKNFESPVSGWLDLRLRAQRVINLEVPVLVWSDKITLPECGC